MQNETSSRARLFSAARRLFAEHGYENTGTSSIVREAGTSESQLIRHFGGKAALLEAIFDDGWDILKLNLEARLREVETPERRLRAIPRLVVEILQRDAELRLLLLLEGRRMRREGSRTIMVDGFRGLSAMLNQTLAEMESAGVLREMVPPNAVAAALIGLTENVMRDGVLSERSGRPAEFVVNDIGALTDAVVDLVYVRPTYVTS
jgi:AcrR family transcriptional regulator